MKIKGTILVVSMSFILTAACQAANCKKEDEQCAHTKECCSPITLGGGHKVPAQCKDGTCQPDLK